MMQLRKIFDDKNALQDACSEDFSRTKRERRRDYLFIEDSTNEYILHLFRLFLLDLNDLCLDPRREHGHGSSLIRWPWLTLFDILTLKNVLTIHESGTVMQKPDENMTKR